MLFPGLNNVRWSKQYIGAKNRKLFSECNVAFAATILDDPIIQGKKNSSRVSTYYDPTTVAELQIIYISWKNIFPAQSPFWSDKTKMWSDSIKGALVVIHENCAWCRRRGIPRLTDYYQPLTTKKVFLLVRPFICPKIIVLFTCEMIVFDIHSVRISCPTTVRTSSGMGQF